MNRPTVVRGFIDNNIMHMLNRMRVLAANFLPDERQVLKRLEMANHAELSVHLTKALYELLGGEPTQAKEPRFDKTRRHLAKKRGRPPRGSNYLSTRERAALLAAEPQPEESADAT